MRDLLHPDAAASAAREALGAKLTYGSAVGTAAAGALSAQWATVIVGAVIGLLGLLLQGYFGYQRHRRSEAEHRARMAAMQPRGADENTDHAAL